MRPDLAASLGIGTFWKPVWGESIVSQPPLLSTAAAGGGGSASFRGCLGWRGRGPLFLSRPMELGSVVIKYCWRQQLTGFGPVQLNTSSGDGCC
jgi:hypothetical protein